MPQLQQLGTFGKQSSGLAEGLGFQQQYVSQMLAQQKMQDELENTKIRKAQLQQAHQRLDMERKAQQLDMDRFGLDQDQQAFMQFYNMAKLPDKQSQAIGKMGLKGLFEAKGVKLSPEQIDGIQKMEAEEAGAVKDVMDMAANPAIPYAKVSELGRKYNLSDDLMKEAKQVRDETQQETQTKLTTEEKVETREQKILTKTAETELEGTTRDLKTVTNQANQTVKKYMNQTEPPKEGYVHVTPSDFPILFMQADQQKETLSSFDKLSASLRGEAPPVDEGTTGSWIPKEMYQKYVNLYRTVRWKAAINDLAQIPGTKLDMDSLKNIPEDVTYNTPVDEIKSIIQERGTTAKTTIDQTSRGKIQTLEINIPAGGGKAPTPSVINTLKKAIEDGKITEDLSLQLLRNKGYQIKQVTGQ